MPNYPIHTIEDKWQCYWRRSGSFTAPDRPTGKKFFNFDSGPFPNGPLHLGHVRTYVLGDVVARYQRLLGKSVLYATEWDAFGLPNEQAALDIGVSPEELTNHNIQLMRTGLERLGVSYDWSRVRSTASAPYYTETKRLFLRLYRSGYAYQKTDNVQWCPSCRTTLDTRQVELDACWRCRSPVKARALRQWYIATSRIAERLLQGVDDLSEWSDTGRKLLKRGLSDTDTIERAPPDWLVSRERTWGTTIPVVECANCGVIPLDEVSGGALQLSVNDTTKAPLNTICPRCGTSTSCDHETLDCFFDDAWSYLSCLSPQGSSDLLSNEYSNAWMPVDHFHSGYDTFAYLNLYRFIGAFLFDQNLLPCSEPIRRYDGNGMVTSSGRKMGKSQGNAVDVESLIDSVGADALRVALLWATRPDRDVDWKNVNLDRAELLLDRIWKLVNVGLPAVQYSAAASVSPTSRRLEHQRERSLTRITSFIERYRPNAAIEEVHDWARRLTDFLTPQRKTSPMSTTEIDNVQEDLRCLVIAVSLFAPHLAEELAERMNLQTPIANATWPARTSANGPKR